MTCLMSCLYVMSPESGWSCLTVLQNAREKLMQLTLEQLLLIRLSMHLRLFGLIVE